MQSEVVIVDASSTANECQNQVFLISNGGGGSYGVGVVTNLILRTHKLASHFSLISGEITVRLINILIKKISFILLLKTK
ncbi:hypothetical protein FSC845_00375 [Francisella persica ATCC VR-331]|nr:hypothetical protein FSC845_00375 [Francisella persica ATCC VR-331]